MNGVSPMGGSPAERFEQVERMEVEAMAQLVLEQQVDRLTMFATICDYVRLFATMC